MDPYWIEGYGLLNTHKCLLLDNIAWPTNEHMSTTMEIIYNGHLKNQLHDFTTQMRSHT